MKRILSTAIVAMFFVGNLLAQNIEQESASSHVSDDSPKVIPGIIFDASSLLFDIDAYSGGFGGMLKYPDHSVRVGLSVGYSSSSSTFGAAASATYSHPIWTGRVEPYWGLAADAGYSLERSVVDADNYTNASILDANVAAIIGAEIFVTDYLSVFGEYQFGLRAVRTGISQSVGGTVTDSSTFNYEIFTGIGNQGYIGVVIYLSPVATATSPRAPL